MAQESGATPLSEQPPPLPPSPMAADGGPQEEPPLPWYVIVATTAAGALSGAATLLLLSGFVLIQPPWLPAVAGGVGALVAAALGAALWIADWLAAHRWRPISWTLALAVPWVVVAALLACVNRTWQPLTVMLAPLVTGPALGAVARRRRLVPGLSLAVGALTGGLFVLGVGLLDAVLTGGGVQTVTAPAVGLMLALGATLFGPFGLAVGLCLHFERKRVEREAARPPVTSG